MRARHALEDRQFDRIKHLLPGRAEDDRESRDQRNRLFIDAVLFVARTGIPWRDLPERFGKWNSVWRRFDRWCASGLFEAINRELADPDLSQLQLDSSSVKVHRSACGSRKEPGEKKRRRRASPLHRP